MKVVLVINMELFIVEEKFMKNSTIENNIMTLSLGELNIPQPCCETIERFY